MAWDIFRIHPRADDRQGGRKTGGTEMNCISKLLVKLRMRRSLPSPRTVETIVKNINETMLHVEVVMKRHESKACPGYVSKRSISRLTGVPMREVGETANRVGVKAISVNRCQYYRMDLREAGKVLMALWDE